MYVRTEILRNEVAQLQKKINIRKILHFGSKIHLKARNYKIRTLKFFDVMINANCHKVTLFHDFRIISKVIIFKCNHENLHVKIYF